MADAQHQVGEGRDQVSRPVALVDSATGVPVSEHGVGVAFRGHFHVHIHIHVHVHIRVGACASVG